MSNDQTASIRWAIEELSKQKDEIESKISVARKRDDTSELIKEVLAQKDALDKRISALEDGLKVSSELVQAPVTQLENEKTEISEKLEIAQERLENLEQEEYFVELGRKLTGKQDTSKEFPEKADTNTLSNDSLELRTLSDLGTPLLANDPPTVDMSPTSPISFEQSGVQTSTQTETMKSTESRIQQNKVESTLEDGSRIPEADVDLVQPQNTKTLKPIAVSNLEETALALGVESDFLVEKATQSVLRMIARNGGKLSFPLEVEQVD
ncbi:MAG: hypothetical protein CML14_03580 [Puniceicoccaceae bacterium]|nr:hypothetical protein [Puniceicoccaceae bacterium]|tara:strand:- start:17353 stop:18153 length:801 start_codon:yes stop_codon:yes gene_type:complete